MTFGSYEAPYLEEAYDTSYVSLDTLAMSGSFAGHTGLGVAPYYMWNPTVTNATFYFGATFKDYVGKVGSKLVMVRPTNGQNYGSFIFGQYFDEMVLGAAAPMNDTLKLIAMIDELPSLVSLAWEDKVVAARSAYDGIYSNEQKALVTNYNKLVSAEQTIEYLKSREQTDDSSTSSSGKTEERKGSFGQFLYNNMFGLILSFVILAGFGVYVFFTVRAKKGNGIDKEQ